MSGFAVQEGAELQLIQVLNNPLSAPFFDLFLTIGSSSFSALTSFTDLGNIWLQPGNLANITSGDFSFGFGNGSATAALDSHTFSLGYNIGPLTYDGFAITYADNSNGYPDFGLLWCGSISPTITTAPGGVSYVLSGVTVTLGNCSPGPTPPVGLPLVTSQTPTNLRNNFTGQVGLTFNVGLAPVTIHAVARWVVAGNTNTHRVGVYSTTGSLLGAATINTAGSPAGAYLYAPLSSPVVLSASTAYALASDESNLGDQWYDDTGDSVTIDTPFNTPVSAFATGGAFSPSSAGEIFVPVNALYTM